MSTEAPRLIAMQQPAGSSLRADFSWTFFGNAIYAGAQWAMVMLLAKLTRPELVGQYALGLAISLPVIMLTNLQLRFVVATDVRQETPFGHYLSFRLLMTAFALAVILAITQIVGYRWQLSYVVVMVGVAQAVEAVSDVYYARLQLHDRMDRVAKSMIARAVLSVLALAIGVHFSGNLLCGIAGVVLARTIILLGYDTRGRTHDLARDHAKLDAKEELRPRWDLKVHGALLWFSLPLGIIAVLVSLNSSIPRFFIEQILGERALGIFSALVFMLAAGSMVVVALGQSAFTRLARYYATENLVEFWLLLRRLLVFGAALGVCGIIVARLAGREILTLLFRVEYAEYAYLLPWLMVAASLGYVAQCLGFGMTAARYYKPQILLFVLTNLSVGMASYWLVPRQGLEGAVFALLISTIVQLLGSVMILLIGMRRQTRAALESMEVT